MVVPGGELVIGNFSSTNPSRDYMEFGEWFLHHRCEEDLINLAKHSDIDYKNIIVDSEPFGVNLFLRLRKQ